MVTDLGIDFHRILFFSIQVKDELHISIRSVDVDYRRQRKPQSGFPRFFFTS